MDHQRSHHPRAPGLPSIGYCREGRSPLPGVLPGCDRPPRTGRWLGWKVLSRMNSAAPSHSGRWKWWICGLLLCASAINYMDRQTLANAATRISRQFALSQEQYGNLEFAFGWAFAVGSLVFGIIVDKFSVRVVYPV